MTRYRVDITAIERDIHTTGFTYDLSPALRDFCENWLIPNFKYVIHSGRGDVHLSITISELGP